MNHWFMQRASGKTTKLIEYAIKHECDILVATNTMAESVLETAVYMGVKGQVKRNRNHGPISIGELRILIPCDLARLDGVFLEPRPILIDEMDAVIERLCNRPVAGYSVTWPLPEEG